MSDQQNDSSPVEQLVELFVYAPVGLLYEYDKVLPQLVRRGKSQVQLAKVLGQMAAKQGQNQFPGPLGELIGGAATLLGQATASPPSAPPETKVARAATARRGSPPSSRLQPDVEVEPAEAEPTAEVDEQLPIVGYDDLRAREIIPLLADLTPTQRERIGDHERANRQRKTVLAKLDSLASA